MAVTTANVIETARTMAARVREIMETEHAVRSPGPPLKLSHAPNLSLLVEAVTLALAEELDRRGIGRLEIP